MKWLLFILSVSLSASIICRDGTNCMLTHAQTNMSLPTLNINGGALESCSTSPITGFYRDGTCRSDKRDKGNHSVCAQVTEEFLQYSKKRGNDLITANPRYNFPGLNDGDFWCLCAARYLEAKKSGINLIVKTKSTHPRALEVLHKNDLK